VLGQPPRVYDVPASGPPGATYLTRTAPFRYGWDMDTSTYVIFAISAITVAVIAYKGSCRKR
jgi:hypothetical protein